MSRPQRPSVVRGARRLAAARRGRGAAGRRLPAGAEPAAGDQQNAQDFTESQDNAIAAASCELGYPPGVRRDRRSPAARRRRASCSPATCCVSVDGTAVSTDDQLTALLAQGHAGQTRQHRGHSRRQADHGHAHARRADCRSHRRHASASRSAPVCAAPFSVDLGLGNQIGGPSAGLMFALGIIDKVGTDRPHQGHVHRRHRHHRPDRHGRPDRRHRAEDDRRAAQGRHGLPGAGQQLRRRARATIPTGLDVVKVATLHDAVARTCWRCRPASPSRTAERSASVASARSRSAAPGWVPGPAR